MSSTTIPNPHICPPILQILDSGVPRFANVLRAAAEIAPTAFRDIALSAEPGSFAPEWRQPYFTWLDALSLCAMLRMRNPERYVEIGCGNSTRVARWCITKYGLRTRIISIDPEPRVEIRQIADEVHSVPAQHVPVEYFSELQAGDILFYDGSHLLGFLTDMTYIGYHVLPVLKPGVMIGMHDTHLPFTAHNMEDYFLGALMLGGTGYSVEFPAHYLASVNSQTRTSVLAMLDTPDGVKVKANHYDIYREHGTNILTDMHGTTFFMSKAA